MAQFEVTGGTPLSGHVSISGNKNAILKLIPASLLVSSPVTLTNVEYSTSRSVKIMESLGASFRAEHQTGHRSGWG
jgi:UDP-N-acetylglucosamine 1-carboxyvinyltransferase